jgi:cbb3-type cytochrome oxidase subunit 3
MGAAEGRHERQVPAGAVAALSPEARSDPKTFVLRRELSEVHLLLDNIASSTEKRLPIAAAGRPGALGEDWLRRVCEIEWPPEGSPPDEARDAELLIRVKDHLNMLAAPASGLTIAFTHLVTHEAGAGRASSALRSAEADGPSRRSLARAAYPDLVDRAQTFRNGVRAIGVFLFAWLLLTCLASWYIAFGNAALAQREAAQAVFLLADARVQEVAAGAASKAGVGTPATNSPPAASAFQPTEAARPVLPACPTASGTTPATYTSVPQRQACTALAEAQAVRAASDIQIAHWMLRSATGGGPALSAYATALAGVLGTAILPVLYGILGAGAAVLRSLSTKMRLSLLAPRDLNLALQQLALGAVMGACIGIFIAQPSTGPGTGATVIGPVALSASALSFLAGFGVDAVFATLESVISRVFNVQPSGAARPDAAN